MRTSTGMLFCFITAYYIDPVGVNKKHNAKTVRHTGRTAKRIYLSNWYNALPLISPWLAFQRR